MASSWLRAHSIFVNKIGNRSTSLFPLAILLTKILCILQWRMPSYRGTLGWIVVFNSGSLANLAVQLLPLLGLRNARDTKLACKNKIR